jgi:hypothetical protein
VPSDDNGEADSNLFSNLNRLAANEAANLLLKEAGYDWLSGPGGSNGVLG